MALTAPNVHVHDTELDADYYVSEARFRNPPKKGLWERLDSGKPQTSVASASAKKQAASGQSADSNQEES